MADTIDAWNTISPGYQAYARIPTDRIHYGLRTPTEDELRLLGDPRGRDIVDVGCGGGQNTIAFRKQGARRVVGVDASQEQLGFARALAEHEGVEVEWVHGHVETLEPLPDASFDAAFSSYCLQFVEDIGATFRSVHRVLRPGSPFAFCLDHPAGMMFLGEGRELRKPYFQRAYTSEWSFEGAPPAEITCYYHTAGDLVNALVEAGFRVERLLEPEPGPGRVGSWREDPWLSERVPTTIILAARKAT